jgi:hypothetical protein
VFLVPEGGVREICSLEEGHIKIIVIETVGWNILLIRTLKHNNELIVVSVYKKKTLITGSRNLREVLFRY